MRPAENQVYLDYQAATPVDSRVLDEMLPFFMEVYANPHATTHRHALMSSRAVETARAQIAGSLGAHPKEIIFTSGATESNNMAILGVAADAGKQRRKVITQTTEHLSVLEPIKKLQSRGFETERVGVQRSGVVDINQLERSIDHRTLLVSVMLVNNETGVIQPVEEIARICKRHDVILHCDCAQALGRVPLNLKKIPIGMATFSAHKIYGPKGVGCLFVRSKLRKILKPILYGGGQEGGLRPGTLPVPLCVGFGRAIELAVDEQPLFAKDAKHRINLIRGAIDATDFTVRYNGDPAYTAPGCLNFSLAGIRAEALLETWSDLELSTGSACTATKQKSSHVLSAMKVPRPLIESAIRLSIGRETTTPDVEKILSHIADIGNLKSSMN